MNKYYKLYDRLLMLISNKIGSQRYSSEADISFKSSYHMYAKNQIKVSNSHAVTSLLKK
jgi:hypothetical protein